LKKKEGALGGKLPDGAGVPPLRPLGVGEGTGVSAVSLALGTESLAFLKTRVDFRLRIALRGHMLCLDIQSLTMYWPSCLAIPRIQWPAAKTNPDTQARWMVGLDIVDTLVTLIR
jgi:hypothetical protein